MSQVFEGRADLNLKPFLDGLKKMETETARSVAKVSQIFQQLDQSIAGSLGGVKAQLAGLAQNISTIGAGIAQANGAAQKGQQQLNQTANQQRATQQRLAQQDAQARAANLQALKLAQQQELSRVQAQGQDIEQALRARLVREQYEIKAGGEAKAKLFQQQYDLEAATIRKAIEEQRRLRQVALSEAEIKKNSQAGALAVGDKGLARQAENEYLKAVQAARVATEQEKSLQRQLTQTVQAERKAQTLVVQAELQRQADLGTDAIRRGQAGFQQMLAQRITDLQGHIKQVEQRWNSIFRAGSQITSFGTQLGMFGGMITALGLKLTDNAGEFDFWARRAVAAATAANSATTNELGEALTTVERYQDEILKLGREIGTLSPTEVAEGWFTYQAALGQTIETEQQMIDTKKSLGEMLKAAVVTNTDYGTVIKGVSQVLGEYGLGVESATEVTHILTSVTQRSQAELSDVIEAFKMVGPLMGELGIGVADTATMMTIMAEAGLKGSMAGRGLQMMMTRLIDTTGPANKALQSVFDASNQLPNGWRDVVFEGGKFIGFLDTLNEKGEVVQKGFFHKFAEATKELSSEQRLEQLAKIFPENAFRNILPLIRQYTDAIAEGGDAGAVAATKIAELQKEFNDAGKQANLFNDQWGIVAEGVKVRMGQATYGIQEALIRLGYVAAEAFLPLIEWVNQALQAFMAWAAKNPELAQTIVGVAAGVGAFLVVAGPLLAMLGQILMGVASLNVAWATITGTISTVGKVLFGIGPIIASVSTPMLLLIMLLGVLYVAWDRNWLGMQGTLAGVAVQFQNLIGAIGSLLGNLLTIIQGFLSGSQETMRAGMEGVAASLLEIFYVIPGELVGALNDISVTIGNWASSTFSSLASGMVVWGHNLMVSLANGVIEGAQYVWSAVESVAEGIAMFFRSFSPPRHGPLKGIYVWGQNLIKTFTEGMRSADIKAVEDIAGRIGTALRENIEAGNLDASMYAETMYLANDKVAEMLEIVRNGGQVNAAFFEELRAGLGDWYDGVVEVALAYQQVYAQERALSNEQKKLDLLKKQRQELDAMHQERMDAFDVAIDANAGTGWRENEGSMVDPTTNLGKQKIAEMKATLSPEEFQNWLNWQRKLWDAKHAEEDKGLQKQEDAQQLIVDAHQTQLDLLKQQYDYFVAMFEYAQRLNDLVKEEQQLEKQQDKADAAKPPKAPAIPTTGTPEQLNQYKDEIAGIVGGDGALKDEQALKNDRGGDDVGAVGDAVKQREREEGRLDALERENRRKRAAFEQELIHATSKEEQAEIKQRKDAWDAAYREEKARLQERLQFTKDVIAAAEEQADASMPGRVKDEEKAYQEEIKTLLGDQTSTIKDANALKETSADLDGAQVAAREQLRTEERKLRDLQELGDKKRLEFEQRILDAAKDPEKVRRIKEEQAAWEASYKAALEAQQERVRAAREASQDLGDEEWSTNQMKPDDLKKAGGGGGGGAGVPGIPDFAGGAGGLDELPTPPWAQPGFKPPWAQLDEQTDKELRPTQLKAVAVFDDLKRAIGFLSDETVPASAKVREFGKAISEALTGDTSSFDDLKRGIDFLSSSSVPAATKVRELGKAIADYFTDGQASQAWSKLTSSWNKDIEGIKKFGNDFWNDITGSWDADVQGIKRWVAPFWNDITGSWNADVQGVKNFVTPFWNDIKSSWDKDMGALKATFGPYWDDLKKTWGMFSSDISTGWNTLWTDVKTAGTTVWGDLKLGWETFTGDVSIVLNGWWGRVKASWETDTAAVEKATSEWWGRVKASWNTDTAAVEKATTEWWGRVKASWSTDTEAVEKATSEWWGRVKTSWGSDTEALRTTTETWWGNIKGYFTGGTSETQKTTETWKGEQVRTFSGWYTETSKTVSTWYSETKTSITSWYSETKKSITDWYTETSASISGWVTDTKTAFQGAIDAVKGWIGELQTKLDTAKGTVDTAMKGIYDAITGWVGDAKDWVQGKLDAIGSLVQSAQDAYDRFISWIGGKKDDIEDDDDASTNSLNRNVDGVGLLSLSRAIDAIGAVPAQVAAAVAPAQAMAVTNNRAGDVTKNVTIGDVRIDASNPDEGKAMLQRLAFLGA